MADIQDPQFPVPDLIHTQRVPTQFEARLARETFVRVHTDMSRLDDEVKRLQEITQELLRSRKALSKYMEKHETVLTPIERLPSELLSEIFIHLLRPKSNQDFFLSVRVPRTWSVATIPIQVCSRWRKVVLSTPELYTSITVGHPKGDQNVLALDVVATQAWLSRSGDLPLSLDFAPGSTSVFHPATD
jgi:hypothetical protein